MNPDEAMALAMESAEAGLLAGELPIGAVVLQGDVVVGRAHTQDRASGQRLSHADLLAMTEADRHLRSTSGSGPLRLVVNLEPCLMCFGATMALGINEVWYGLESPGDGGAEVISRWTNSDDAPWFRAPAVQSGVLREQVRDQFRRYCRNAPPSGFRRWAESLATLPDS